MTDFAPHGPLRRLGAEESPFPGVLVGSDPPRVWTDAALWEETAAWRADADGHVLAPLDVCRTATGTGVLIARCPQTLAAAVAPAAHLTAGERVTVAVSLLRGAAEADRLDAAKGRWWLSTERRPLLALTGETPWREETRELLETMREGAPTLLADALSAAVAALDDPRRLRFEREAVEDALFAAEAPEPLTCAFAPQRARRLAVATKADDAAETPPRRMPALAHAVLGNDLTARIADALAPRRPGVRQDRREESRERRRRDRPSSGKSSGKPSERAPRRRLVLVAAAAAAIIIGVGALWPDAPDEAVGRTPDPGAASAPTTASAPATASIVPSTPVPDATVEEDPVSALRRLLAEDAGCAEADCRARVFENPDQATELSREFSDIRLVDDYGDVAVVAGESDEGEQFIVLARRDEKWLVRDVYDATDQP